MTEENQVETDAQRAKRSALGGFERDAKTFQGHYDRIMASAEAFVKRCEKFARQEPGHPRLQETVDLLAEAKRITGQHAPAVREESPPPTPDPGEYPADAGERLAGIETAVHMLARLALATDHVVGESRDQRDALSYLHGWLGHLAPLAKREPEPNGMDPSAAERIAALPDGSISGQLVPDPAAGLLQREQERVQAVLDAAAAKAAPVNPLAAALAPPVAAPVDPFVAFRAAAPPA